MPLHDFYDFVQPGFVSIWIGDFRSEADFDEYLSKEFPSQFGVEIPFQAPQEIGAKEAPVPVGQLIEGFSRSRTFAPEALKLAEDRGITAASSMFIVYNVKYDPACQLVQNPTIQFLGAFSFPGFS